MKMILPLQLKKSLFHFSCFVFWTLFCSSTLAQSFPPGFSQVLIANGIANPTVMSFAPDGRIFIAQQNGVLRFIKNGTLQPYPFLTLNVHSSGERGLIGLAIDPQFEVNRYIYVYYTVASGAHNRISRFIANGDTVLAGSEQILLTLDPLSTATNHNGGNMQFGTDGKLYIGIGENANTAHAQNLDTYHGKVLRVNADGTIPEGNPYKTGSEQRKRIWSYGLRNPYTLSFDQRTSRLFINDVGQNSWEEINITGRGGDNFGWPSAEGNSTNSSFTNPLFAYGHGNTLGKGCAITGGTFFNPLQSNYPSSYYGNYFYIDYCGRWIDVLNPTSTPVSRSSFASGLAGNPVCLMTGNDGNLYYLSRNTGSLYKIVYGLNSPPVIALQPQSLSIAENGQATFEVSVSGTLPMSYQWYKNDIPLLGAEQASCIIQNAQQKDSGSYFVQIKNDFGEVRSLSASLQINPPNSKPKAHITTPQMNTTYGGGDTIYFSGYGTDEEDGNLDKNNLTWKVEFHHDMHTHPGPALSDSIDQGSFIIPSSGETSTNVYYRLYLMVKDSKGDTDTSFTDLLPRKSIMTLKTLPDGLTVSIDGQPCAAPCIVNSVEGIIRSIDAPSPQSLNGAVYAFSNWSHGGAKYQLLITPGSDSVFFSSFIPLQNFTIHPIADAYVRSGSSANNNFGSNVLLYARNNSLTKGVCLTYLRFDLSLIADPAVAKLRLYGKFDKTGNTTAVDLFDVPSQSWSEQSITYNNRPPENLSSLGSVTVSGSTAKYYEWDLTQYVLQRKNAGASSFTLLVRNRNTTSGFLQFNSRENVSFKPELVITQKSETKTFTSPALPMIKLGKDIKRQYIRVSPNPASYFIKINHPSFPRFSKAHIYDLAGRLHLETVLYGPYETILNIAHLPRGVYLIQISDATEKAVSKFFIEK